MRAGMMSAAVLACWLLGCGSALPAPTYPLTATRAAAFRKSAPEPLARSEAWPKLSITERTLSNGLHVVVASRPGSSLASVVYLNRRAGMHPVTYPSDIASLTADVMRRGYFAANGEPLYEPRIGGREPEAMTWENGSSLQYVTLREGYRAAIHAIAQIVQRPVLSDDDVAYARARQGDDLYDSTRTVDGLVRPLKSQLLFGDGHRFAIDNRRWASDLAQITTSDVRRYYQATYQPEYGTLIVVGDVMAEEAIATVEAELGLWLTAGGDPPPLARGSSLSRSQREHRIFAVLQGGSTSLVTVLHPLPGPRHPDLHAFGVLHQLVAGNYGSALWNTLRHDSGLTYGVYGGLTMFDDAGYLEIEARVDNDEAYETLEAILAAIDTLVTTPPSEADLAIAKTKYLATLQPPTVDGLTWQIVKNLSVGLPASTHNDAVDQVQHLTPADVMRVAKAHLSSEDAVALTFGNFYTYGSNFLSRDDVRQFELRSSKDEDPRSRKDRGSRRDQH